MSDKDWSGYTPTAALRWREDKLEQLWISIYEGESDCWRLVPTEPPED